MAPCSENPLPEPPPPSNAGALGERSIVWADVERARDPDVAPSVEWAIWQLVPSPELGFGEDGTRFGLRWQFIPLLYSFATDARLNRWRGLIAEPIVRHSGSIELFTAPEYLALDGGIENRFGVSVGLRSYFGLVGRGDQLSVSIGGAYYHFAEADGVSFEAGAYALFGSIGLVLTYSPDFDAARWITSVRLKYF